MLQNDMTRDHFQIMNSKMTNLAILLTNLFQFMFQYAYLDTLNKLESEITGTIIGSG